MQSVYNFSGMNDFIRRIPFDNRFTWLLLWSAVALLIVTGAFFQFGPSSQQIYLDRQTAAMKPEFGKHIKDLSEAPRYSLIASVNPESRRITAQMRLEYTNSHQTTLSRLSFRLYPNATSIYGGGELTVERAVQDNALLQTELSEDGTILFIFLNSPLAPGKTVDLSLNFRAQIPALSSQGYGIFSQNGEVTSLAGWYPLLAPYSDGWKTPPVPQVGDAMFAETSFYEVRLAAPAELKLASTGTVIGKETREAQTTWHIVSGPVREFAVALSPQFEILERRQGDTILRLYTLPSRNPATSAGEGLNIFEEAFNLFSEQFGPYPYRELDMVETAVSIGGYEFPGMVYVDDDLRVQEPFDRYQYLAAHELAHQWWYNLAGNHTINEPWLDEAHASYAGVLYFEQVEGKPAGERFLANWEATDGTRESGDPPVNSSALEFSSWAPYRRTVYVHGALFIEELRQEMGDEKFFEFLRKYQETYRYQIASTADYLALAEEVAGRQLDPTFTAWLRLTAEGSRN
jgi:hypothetical protein